MEQIFILVIFAAIALMKWLASNKAGDFKPGPPKDTTSAYGPIQRREEDTEEARMRRFMEALGVPPGSAPRPLAKLPPPIARPVVEPPRVKPMQKLPPAIAPVAPPKKAVETPALMFETDVAPREKSSTESVTAKKTAPSAESNPVLPGGDLRGLLKSGVSLRDAVVLREILGPPRSLQSSY